MDTKRFPLRVILTVTTYRLLTESKSPRDNGIGDLYKLLGWMTNDTPFTHQLSRLVKECQPWLLRWFPEIEIASVCMTNLDKWLNRARTCPDEGVKLWLAELQMTWPAIKDEYDVPRIPQDDHEHKNPYDELVTMRGTDEGIVLVEAPAPPKSSTPN